MIRRRRPERHVTKLTHQQSGEAGETEAITDTESTSVISSDELQAYFSRLAQEVNDSEASDSSAADDVDNQEEN
ncbi:MAG: hypothetical protein E6833_28080 [Bradyrhizobium sp.]|nr:hypothetical protein [Bradyrhizobium sp.]